MSYTYAERKKAEPAGRQAEERSVSGRSMSSLLSGARMPGREELGRRVDLSEAIRAKMESSFGADLSGVRLYESRSVADAGAEAVAQGNNIVFAPGNTDFSSRKGQQLLGHELSHVMSQARGEVTGRGFLNSSALEARADREGAMAAAGEQVYGGAAAPLSAASAAPAAGPMQASKRTAPEKKASKLAAMAEEVEDMKHMDTSEYSDKKRKKYQEKLNKKYMDYQRFAGKVGSDEETYHALYKMRNDKRKKELALGDDSEYASQDRYGDAIEMVEEMQNRLMRKKPQRYEGKFNAIRENVFSRLDQDEDYQNTSKEFMEKNGTRIHGIRDEYRFSRKRR